MNNLLPTIMMMHILYLLLLYFDIDLKNQAKLIAQIIKINLNNYILYF